MLRAEYILAITLIAVLTFGGMAYFFQKDSLRGVNDRLAKEWQINPKAESQPKETSTPVDFSQRNNPPLPTKNPLDRPKIVTSSLKNPINYPNTAYITGNNVTYVIPSNMRTMQLKIRKPNGSIASEYTLPHWAIKVGPKYSIQLKVRK